jgi:hypothetical protein
MTNILDPGNLFPNTDEILPTSTPGTPLGYDLTQLLSSSMKARPPWMSFAKVASNVLYQYVEQNRIALELSREPSDLTRILKIITLKMMGLDWNSELITDDNYDTLLESISLYLRNHGPNDFINYIGYSLGFSMQMIELWTTDYIGFFPGPQEPNIFDYGPDEQIPNNHTVWYPTTHVGLLYELYATNAPSLEVIDGIQNVFYKIAPIHLVLEFIGAMITGSVGTLYACVLGLQKGEFYAIAEYKPSLILYFDAVPYEIHTEIALCQPLHPDRQILGQFAAYAVDTGLEQANCQTTAIVWTEGYQPSVQKFSYENFYDVPDTQIGEVCLSLQPNDTWGYWSTPQNYLLAAKNVTLLVSSSGNPLTSNWIAYGMKIFPNFNRYDGFPGYNVASLYPGGSVASGNITAIAGCVIFIFRPTNGTAIFTISRGADTITVNISTQIVTATSGVTNSGLYQLGSGFWVLWGVMSGGIIEIFPGGINGSGSFDWLDFQVVAETSYPTPIPSTMPTLDAVYYLPQSFLQFNSILQQLLYQPDVDFGFVDDSVIYALDLGSIADSVTIFIDAGVVDWEIIDQLISGANVDCGFVSGGQFIYVGYTDSVVTVSADLGSVADSLINLSCDLKFVTNTWPALPRNVYYFYNGIAEVGVGYPPLTNSILTFMAGIQTFFEVDNFNLPYGIAIFEVLCPFAEWQTVSIGQLITVLQILDANNGLYIGISATQIQITLHQVSHFINLIDGIMRICILWSPTNTTIYINGISTTFADVFVNVTNCYLFNYSNAAPTSTWLLRYLLIMGADNADSIPNAIYAQQYSGSILYNLANVVNNDFGTLFEPIKQLADFGFVTSAINDSIDLQYNFNFINSNDFGDLVDSITQFMDFGSIISSVDDSVDLGII